jgi:hypothetical protein
LEVAAKSSKYGNLFAPILTEKILLRKFNKFGKGLDGVANDLPREEPSDLEAYMKHTIDRVRKLRDQT